MNTNRPSETFMVLPGMRPKYTSDPKHPGERRLPGCGWLSNRVRNMFISMLGEFVGTYLFLFFAFAATQVANTPPGSADAYPNVSTLLYISLAFGFSLAVNVWVFFRISGGLFNPAVTVALALVGALGWLKAALLIVSQVLAGIAAAGVVSALFPGNLAVRTVLNPATSITRGLFIEMLLTAELIFTIFMLAAEKHKATFLAPIGIGLSLFIAELAGVFFTGGSLNPARSFGPDVILHTFDGYHWIYWVGPLLGAIVAVIFYRLIKRLEYETANPGADYDGGRDYINDPPVNGDGARYRTTDGTDESDFAPSIRQVSIPAQRQASSSHYNSTSADSSTSEASPTRPLPIYEHGGDAHYSRSSFDSGRPRAQHNHVSSRSSTARGLFPRSDHSFRSGPDVESGSAGYSSTTPSHSTSRASS